MLIDAGAEIDHQNLDRSTALIYAAASGSKKIVEALLAKKPDQVKLHR